MVAIVTGSGLGVERSSGSVLGGQGQLGSASFGRLGENIYINAATGNLTISRTDEILIGEGPDDILTRTYNSLGCNAYNHMGNYGANGDNWQLNVGRRVSGSTGTKGSSGTVTIVDWDGSELTYTWDSTQSAYVCKAGGGAFDTVTYSGGTWTWTDGNTRVRDLFSDANGGRITSTKDLDNKTLTYAYDTDVNSPNYGRLLSVTTANGESTNFDWDATTHNLLSVTTKDAGGTTLVKRVTYQYDSLNRLQRVITDLSPEDAVTSDNNFVRTEYAYDGTTDRILSITQQRGGNLHVDFAKIVFTYDGSGRVSTFTQTVDSGVTRTTTLHYNSSTQTAVEDEAGQNTTLTFDSLDQLTKVEFPDGSGGISKTLTFGYDSEGNVTSEKVGTTLETKLVYVTNGNVWKICDPAGDTVEYTYGSKNEVLTATRYLTPDGDEDPNSSTQTPGQPLTTYYAYDSENHLIFAVSPEGVVTQNSYFNAGELSATFVYGENVTDGSSKYDVSILAGSASSTWLTTLTNWANARNLTTRTRSDFQYDSRGNLTSATDFGKSNSGGAGTSPSSNVTYSFDQFGNMLTRQTPNFNTETFQSDGLGRVTLHVDLNGTAIVTSYDDKNNKVSVNVGAATPHLTRVSTYNMLGQLKQYVEINSSNSATVTPATAYTYDSLGRLRMVKDGAGNYTHYLYDAIGRKVAEIAGDGSMTEFTYDGADRVQRTIHYATKANTTLLVDVNGNALYPTLASIRPAASNGPDDWDLYEWRVYDDASRVIEIVNGAGECTFFTYDGDSNLITTTMRANRLSSSSIAGWKTNGTIITTLQTPSSSSLDHTTTNFYDNDERLIGVLNAGGYVTQFKYDNSGQKTEAIAYANAATVTSGTFATVLASVTLDSTNDRHTHYVYDGRGYLRFELFEVTGGLQVSERTYDGNGNVTQVAQYKNLLATSSQYILESVEAAVAAAGFTTTEDRRSFSVYDAAHRLAYSIDAGGAVTRYQYDGIGQLTKATQFATTYATTTLPPVSTMDTWAGANGTAGDRIGRTVYDLAGKVAYQVDGESYITEYQYDSVGRVQREIRYDNKYTILDTDLQADVDAKIGANDPNATTYFSYDAAGRVASETHAYGTLDESTTTYTYDGMGQLLTKVDGRGNTTSYGYDGAGNIDSVTVPLAGTGTATTAYLFDAFGNVVQTTIPRHKTDTSDPISYVFYDKLDRAILQIDALKQWTETAYTAFGNVQSVKKGFTPIAGSITAGGTPPTRAYSSSEDELTQFTYDRRGQLTSSTDAEGFTEYYQYDNLGNRSQFTNKLGGATNYTYDKRGLLLSEAFTTMTSTRADGTQEAASVTNKYEYDARGNRTKTTEAFGLADERVTIFAYDKLNRLTQTTHETVAVINADLTSGGNVTPVEVNTYDSRGNIIKTVRKSDGLADSTGTQSFFYYDDLNRKTWEINALGTLSKWAYDDNGNVTDVWVNGATVTLPASPGGDCPYSITGTNSRHTHYDYDLANRLTLTTVTGVVTGEYNTSTNTYGSVSTDIVVQNVYDDLGNVVQQLDARGNSVFFYYDKLNRKVAQVDQERYLTTYTFDPDGNVTTEKRWTNPVAIGTTITTTTQPTVTADATNDRVTNFTYDKNGRRLTEERTGVVYYTVDPTTGALGSALTGTSKISYAYNGLGEVTRKTEATDDYSATLHTYDDYTDYTYDTYGRQTSISKAAFDDYRTGTTTYADVVTQYYDGLNNLVRTFEADQDTGITADRITTFSYDSAGRLASMTDASGFTHTYSYDKYGQLILDAYSRLKSDGTSVTEGRATNYDLLGRVILQAAATYTTSWSMADTSQTQYNVFGEVSARGLNGMWQETFEYDTGGHMWRSTAGDGTTRLYVYDKNGAQTLTIASSGAALPAGYTWAGFADIGAALSLISANGGYQAPTVAGMALTVTVNDKRGQATSTREVARQLDSATTQTIVNSRVYNAFGEVKQETNARGYVSDYTYSTLGRVTQRQSPTVNWTAENGTVASARPTENYFYDLSGRLVGVQDANGNTNTRSLLAGTGHGGKDDEPLVLTEFHADTGQYVRKYDIFGDLRTEIDEVGKTETLIYDKMGRLVEQDHQQRTDSTQLKDYFGYDGLGQRIKHWNSQYYSGGAPTYLDFTDYDAQGRVTKTKLMAAANGTGGDVTTYSYTWSGTLATTGLGTFGGWTKATVNSANKTLTEKLDYFGRLVDKIDYGSHDYNYTFDLAGRMTQSSITGLSGSTTNYTYYNTNLAATIVTGSVTSSYKYDAAGNRTFEGYQSGSTWLEYANVTYDALNRMTALDDTGADSTTGTPSITWQYDKNSNIRNMHATYRTLDDTGNVVTTGNPLVQDYWYKYDSMNRFTLTKGTMSAGVISQGADGMTVTYNAAGQRASTSRSYSGSWQEDVNGGEPGVPPHWITHYYSWTNNETYTYSADGYLASVGLAVNYSGETNGQTNYSITQATYARDAMGRVTDYQEFQNGVSGYVYRRQVIKTDGTSGYNEKSQVLRDIVTTVRSNGTWTATTTYDYLAESSAGSNVYTGAYMGGLVTHQATYTTFPGDHTNSEMRTYYSWWDSAVTSSQNYDAQAHEGGAYPYYSNYTYDALGHLGSVAIHDGHSGTGTRNITFTSDANAQILKRYEDGGNVTGDPTELHFYLSGMRVGDISNNGTSNVDYAASIAEHRRTPGSGPFMGGRTSSENVSYADFDQSYDPINGLTYDSTPQHYTVNEGETLQSIAQTVWGDASLWYLIADANGLLGTELLVSGQELSIPNKVRNIHNNSDTYRVYDPNEAIGNTSPTQPKKPKHPDQKCGVMGQIVLAVIAVAVAWYLAPLIAGAIGSTILGGALAGAAGSIVSQGVGLATGIQSKFDWGGVAMAAIGGGVSGAMAPGGLFGEAGAFGGVENTFVQGFLRGATASAVTQGIGVALGLQKRFDWAGVAAAGVGQGVSNWVSSQLPGHAETGTLTHVDGSKVNITTPATLGNQFVSGAAGLIANAATRTLANGSDFGDNIIAALPDFVAQTVGNALSAAAYAANAPDGGMKVEKSVDTDVAPVRITPAIETVVVSAVTTETLKARWAIIENGRDALGIPPEMQLHFVPKYAVEGSAFNSNGDIVGDTTLREFETRGEADAYAARANKAWADYIQEQKALGRPLPKYEMRYGEVYGRRIGQNNANIYAGAVDPVAEPDNTFVSYFDGIKYATYRTWQAAAIDTVFHEQWHAIDPKNPVFHSEYGAFEYAAERTATVLKQHPNIAQYLQGLWDRAHHK